MADQLVLGLDMGKDPGKRLSVEAREELAIVAPSAVPPNSVSTAKLKDEAVTAAKIAPGAVTTSKIATNGVETVNIKADAVTEPKIADNAVTPEKVGTGVVKAVDSDDNPVDLTIKFLTALQWAATTPDPNYFYAVSS